MSIEIGSRVDYQGDRWVVISPASYLAGKRWILVRRNGNDSRSGWSQSTAMEADLSNPTLPTFEIGETVKAGYPPWRKTGTVAEIVSGERTRYRVEIPPEKEETEEGTRYWNSYSFTLGPEFINI